MVLIKNDMNLAEDIEESTDDVAKAEMGQARDLLEPLILALTEEVTTASANALTIESRVAELES
jgi:uncharacterized protein (DUF2336 family)